MSIDLHEPVATVRSVAHTAAEKAADLAPTVDLPRVMRRRRGWRTALITVTGLAAAFGIGLWLVRRRATEAVPAVAPDPFGTGVAATEGVAAHG